MSHHFVFTLSINHLIFLAPQEVYLFGACSIPLKSFVANKARPPLTGSSTMSSTSTSNRLSSNKFNQRNWLSLPYDVMANILYRIGVVDILENAHKVCTTWHKICKDPAMWRVIYMENIFNDANARPRLRKMCKHVVDRSQGQLVDITIVDFADEELLEYIADRSSKLRRLEFACCCGYLYNSWDESLKKLPLLEELSLYITNISNEAIETAGRCCPMLTTFKLNLEAVRNYGDEKAIAIGKNLTELTHLELIGDFMSNTGLQAILDGCRCLESLDLRRCSCISLEGEIGKECLEKIKCLKLPNYSLEGCPYIFMELILQPYVVDDFINFEDL